jgi:hypothetical protein
MLGWEVHEFAYDHVQWRDFVVAMLNLWSLQSAVLWMLHRVVS